MRIIAGLSAFALFFSGSAALAVSPWIVFFETGSARISTETASILDNVAASYRAVGIRGFQLVGHADRVGSAQTNVRLARRRAEAVRAALIQRGIPATAIESIESMGEDRPLVETDAAETQNRRVEIVITCINNPDPGFEYMRCRG